MTNKYFVEIFVFSYVPFVKTPTFNFRIPLSLILIPLR